MKKLIKGWGIFILIVMVTFASLYTFIPDPFENSYQRVMVRQYDRLLSQKENKLIFLGTSTLAFGLDMDTMEEKTGKPVVILGNHIGIGIPFLAEMSKANLKPGDIVVIELSNQKINEGAAQLILTGIGSRYDMYRFFIPELRKDVLFSIPIVLRKKIGYDVFGGPETILGYTADSFDERGNMIFVRNECKLSDPYDGAAGWADFEPGPLNEGFVEYLNDYTAYCKERGVTVLYTVQHTFDEQVTASDEQIDERDRIWQSQLDAPIISQSKDYKLPRKYIWDGHCNSAGQIYRTELLYDDLKPYLNNTIGEK